MTVMFHDIHKNDNPKTEKQRLEGLMSDEVLYADDTICISKTVAAMNRLVKMKEEQGAKYGLKLNHKKCEYLSFGKQARITYQDGTRIPFKKEVKYLGVVINDKADVAKEVANKITECKKYFIDSNYSTHKRINQLDSNH